jgi:hypothetical protein
MSLEAAANFMGKIERGVSVFSSTPEFPLDLESILCLVTDHGEAAGFHFTSEEYAIVATEYVESLLAQKKINGEGRFLLFRHGFSDDGHDGLFFVRGSKEVQGALVHGDACAMLIGGIVRNANVVPEAPKPWWKFW